MVDLKAALKRFRRRKFPFKFIYSDAYWMVDLGNHVFPIKKYLRIYEKLLGAGAGKDNFLSPFLASDEDLELVHSPRYVKKIRSGRLSHSELAALEIPYSSEGVEFAFLNVGGTILAAETALAEGLAVHIGGGFHHAFAEHGEGFCVFNDVAVALEKMRLEGRITRAMVVDCDVHQGNGTADIFSGKDYAFTFSIHQMDLYPAHKPPGSLDVGLWSGDGDEKYLAAMRKHFPRLYLEEQPELVFYLAGADPYDYDQLGALRLSQAGLQERDEIVIDSACRLGLPLVVVLAGGYAWDLDDTVAIHLNTIAVAQQAYRKFH
jgi:acetoin utilization deacetylase AcuC-like enzyme